MVPVVSNTVPPLEITRVLYALPPPTVRELAFDQRELLPVTRTVLLEEVVLLPIVPPVFCTLPP